MAFTAIELPVPDIKLEVLQDIFQQAVRRMPPEAETLSAQTLPTLKELTERLMGSTRETRLRDVLALAKSRIELVMLFTTLLELLKNRRIRVCQDSQFDDIMITNERSSQFRNGD